MVSLPSVAPFPLIAVFSLHGVVHPSPSLLDRPPRRHTRALASHRVPLSQQRQAHRPNPEPLFGFSDVTSCLLFRPNLSGRLFLELIDSRRAVQNLH